MDKKKKKNLVVNLPNEENLGCIEKPEPYVDK